MYKSTLHLTEEDVRHAIGLSPSLRDYIGELLALAKPIVWIDAIPEPSGDPLSSRFGGTPLMLDEVGWPSWVKNPYLGSDTSTGTFIVYYGEPAEAPLTFLGQINLAELPPVTPLPRSGLISFFVDAAEAPWGDEENLRDGFRVYFTPSERFRELRPRPMPNGPPARGAFEAKPLRPCRMRFAARYQLPAAQSLDPPLLQKFGADAYGELAEFLYGFSYHNVMFSVPRTHQHDPRLIAEDKTEGTRPARGRKEPYDAWRRREEAVARNWEVLLSVIDSDDVGLNISGCLTFLLHRSDLAAGRFEHLWFVRGS